MAERAPISLEDFGMAVGDVHDILLVVGLVLNADATALRPAVRDALATVVRLGVDRARVAHMGLDDVREGLR
ncbi:MAG: hypothetical protein ACRYGP_10555 [Janthinobacterium lividum]